jgi:uncharacterized surface protein with fasciclin (FAS1) repeats
LFHPWLGSHHAAACRAAPLLQQFTTSWTFLAPIDSGFNSTLANIDLNATYLLAPENTALLTTILSYHIIPTHAYTMGVGGPTGAGPHVGSTTLTDTMNVSTALPGANSMPLNLTVKVRGSEVDFTNAKGWNATVLAPNIMVGLSVVQIVDILLLPPGDVQVIDNFTLLESLAGSSLNHSASLSSNPSPIPSPSPRPSGTTTPSHNSHNLFAGSSPVFSPSPRPPPSPSPFRGPKDFSSPSSSLGPSPIPIPSPGPPHGPSKRVGFSASPEPSFATITDLLGQPPYKSDLSTFKKAMKAVGTL